MSIKVVLLVLSLAVTVFGQLCVPPTGSNATSVIGQEFFNTSTNNNALNTLFFPTSVIVDSDSQKVYVTDQNNHRILRFTSTSALVSNASAELVLFGNTTNVCSNTTLNLPDQLDYLGTDLYVSDSSNNRVLKLQNAPTANSSTTISLVLGADNSSLCVTTPTTLQDLNYPSGVAITQNGTLYVSEAHGNGVNCFIKRFDNATTNHASPSSLLGNGSCIVASNLSISDTIYHLSVDDIAGHLFAADYSFGRVILFKNAHLKPNASAAIDTVFGKDNATDTTTPSCLSSQLQGPQGVFYDEESDTLIVSDQLQQRVAFFANALLVSSGANNSLVLGQASQSVCAGAGTSASQVSSPFGVYYDNSFPGLFLLLADQSNNRVLRFECTNATFTQSISISQTLAATSPGSSSGVVASSSLVANSSEIVANSSGVAASSSGVVVASSSGVVVASSSGVVASSSGVVVASSSGVVASSSGIAASSSGVVPESSSGVVPESSSGVVPSITATSSESQSNTPSVTDPLNTQTASPIQPVIPASSGVSVVPPVCGNGIVEAGEQCDAGSAVPRTKCCTPFCTNLRVRAPCGKATSKCTKRPKCGRSPTSRQLVCNPGVPKKVGKKCGKGGIFSRKTCKADGTCSKN